MVIQKYLTPKEAAAYLKCSTGHLAKLRCYGGGPTYIKHGGMILYTYEWLDQYLEKCRMKATGIPFISPTSTAEA